ncbi:MAG: alpha-hydroxy acid oxidase [Blastocatellia bacterium]
MENDTPLNLHDFEALARARMPHSLYEYIASGAGEEITLRRNRTAFDELSLWPQTLIDATTPDTRVTLPGRELAHPILLAPTAYHRAVHPEGEMGTAIGAGREGAIYVVSANTTTPIEDIARVAAGPLWFQLYIQPDRGFMRELIARVTAAGCEAIVVTADQAMPGMRDRQRRANFRLPPDLTLPHIFHAEIRARQQIAGNPYPVTIADIEFLRSITNAPVWLKGILHPRDADAAVAAGVAGLIVSNHGARILDTVPATIDALPRIVEAVAGRAPVLVDGGIRRGTDVVKALALGANAVLIGRSYLYGLSLDGAAGVARVVHMLRRELEMAMALTGRRTIAEIDRGVLWER